MKKHNNISIDGVQGDEDNNLFNRASSRVHGYSSRMSRYVRLSIGLRASIGYSVLLLRHLIPFALLLTIFFGFLQAPGYAAKRQSVLSGGRITPVEGVEVLEDVPVPIGDEDAPQEDGGAGYFLIYDGWGVAWDLNIPRIRLLYMEGTGEGKAVQLLFSLSQDWRILKGLYAALAVMMALLAFSFMTRGRRVNAKLLRPVQEITKTAQQMGEKNLSARINVAGTQNELRDLAVVINDMLNRIEAAYNRQKQFVSDASHELRTPIAVLQGYAGLLERWGKDNPDVRDEAIGAIVTETQSMKELVENLLFLARHDKKTLSLTLEPFDGAEMLHELIKETAIIATGHRILTGPIAECAPVADRATIKQAVRVFVDNAVKYTPAGGSVEISSHIKDRSLLINVADSGPGIKKADLARVFDRFFRADEARNSQTTGHGLGLSIARIIAASHGGRIHVKSRPGIGSVFTLEIPLEADAKSTL